MPNKGITKVPCRECEKTPRHDYFGYCMDCADENGVSDLFAEEVRLQNLLLLEKRSLTPQEKENNVEEVRRIMEEKYERGDEIDPILLG